MRKTGKISFEMCVLGTVVCILAVVLLAAAHSRSVSSEPKQLEVKSDISGSVTLVDEGNTSTPKNTDALPPPRQAPFAIRI